MKNIAITVVGTVVLAIGVALAVGGWASSRANLVFDAKDAEIVQLMDVLERSGQTFADEKDILKTEVKYWTDRVSELGDTNLILCGEIAEWEACAARRKVKKKAKPTLPVAEIQPTFTDRVQASLKGVVHLQAPQWQGSGFVVGPRLIVTARHCVEGVDDFILTTVDGHSLNATRAISDKDHDVAFIWVDDLTCKCEAVGGYDHFIKHGGIHQVVLTPLPLGSIKDCVLGQNVYVIGSPYGKINFNSLTTGVISGVNRDWNQLGYDYGWKVAFTVDSAGHPGNSGCPVFTTDGVVRGTLVGGFSPVLISVMPCDLFLADLEVIRMMFITDRYEREEAAYYDEWYNYREDNEYY